MDDKKEVKVEQINTTPQDGFVDEKDINPVDMDNYHKYFKGYSTNEIISTNDPRITRPFVKIVSGIFIVIGILELLFCFIRFSISNVIFGLLFLFISIFGLKKANSDIDKVEQEYKKNPNYNEKMTQEEKHQYINTVKSVANTSYKETFTKQSFNWLKKQTIIICSIIDIFLFILLSISINIVIGIIILVIAILIELLYLIIISKLIK